MNSEVREVRPFVGLGPFEQAFVSTRLHFGDEVCKANEMLLSRAENHTFTLKHVWLEWADDAHGLSAMKARLREGAEALGVSRDSVSVVAVAYTTYLRDAAVVLNINLSEIDRLPQASRLTDGERTPAFSAWRSGFSVEVFALLNRAAEKRPLYPWRLGTWLSKVQFRITTEEQSSRLFRPLPLNAERRESLGLPSKVMRYVDLGEHDPLEAYPDQHDEPAFYIDEDYLAELSAAPSSSAASAAAQLELALHFISGAVYQASRAEGLRSRNFEDVEDSLIERIIRLCAGPGASREDRRQLFAMFKEEPGKLIAIAEDKVDVRQKLLDNLKDPEE